MCSGCRPNFADIGPNSANMSQDESVVGEPWRISSRVRPNAAQHRSEKARPGQFIAASAKSCPLLAKSGQHSTCEVGVDFDQGWAAFGQVRSGIGQSWAADFGAEPDGLRPSFGRVRLGLANTPPNSASIGLPS